jgi:hypothetical protein
VTALLSALWGALSTPPLDWPLGDLPPGALLLALALPFTSRLLAHP